MKRRNLLRFLPLSLLPLSPGEAVASTGAKLKADGSGKPASGNPPASGEKLWLVGEVYPQEMKWNWGFVGIFNDMGKALEVCLAGNFFIAPVVLNDNFNDVDYWPGGCFYPNQYSESKRIDDFANHHELVLNRVSNIRLKESRVCR